MLLHSSKVWQIYNRPKAGRFVQDNEKKTKLQLLGNNQVPNVAGAQKQNKTRVCASTSTRAHPDPRISHTVTKLLTRARPFACAMRVVC